MATVKTDSTHYSNIASALRALHGGEETYTPAEMAEYLATQGTELKSENIAEGISIFGVKGSMKYAMYDDWPDGIPPVPEFDEVAKELDPDAAGLDKMLLMDELGNVTVGYMYGSAVTGLYDYNGVPLLPLPDWDKSAYPYAVIVVERRDAGNIYKVELHCSSNKILGGFILSADRNLYTAVGSDYMYYYYYESDRSGGWKASAATVTESSDFYEMSHGDTLTWANHNVYQNAYITPSAHEAVLESSEPVAAGFRFSSYNYMTTEFRAVGWLRLGYHTTGDKAGQITLEDFRTEESGGYNYVKNLRWSSRESLQYLDDSIWPRGPQRYSYNGCILPPIPSFNATDDYPYCFILLYTSTLGMDRYVVIYTNEAWYRDGSAMKSPLGSQYLYYQPCNFANAYGGATSSYYDYNQVVAFIGGKVIWSNYDMLNADGSVHMAASTPTPVRMPDPV